MLKTAFIRKLPNGKWKVLSEKGKHLGTFDTKELAIKRLKQVEWFKHHKKASETETASYSSIMRELNKQEDFETMHDFQTAFKDNFDRAVLLGDEEPEEIALEAAMKVIAYEQYQRIVRLAATIDLDDPTTAGKYLADLIRFLLRRIRPEKRNADIQVMKKKVYYINEYDIASKKVPVSAVYGQTITLLKHLLIEHPPQYIRQVLNSVAKNL